MAKQGKDIVKARVLVMGATFKENVEDIRNSKVADVINELKNYSLHVDVVDPYADGAELQHEYGFGLLPEAGRNYDAIIVAVNHRPYLSLDESYFRSIAAPKAVLVDIKGIYRGKIGEMVYWSL
jgi:UDP-N-acetyl-D-galactosamine dehydrogenase